jgi:hypothetical protein
MILKIIRERSIRGKKRVGEKRRRELTFIIIMLHHHKIFRERVQKGKEMVRIG